MPSLLRGQRGDSREREPLLPLHNQDTALRAGLEEKLHTFQILKALSHGYMPSNEQLVARLRCATDFLRTVPADISPSSKELIRALKEHLEQLIAFIEDKNSGDQVQDFLWYTTKSRFSVDTENLEGRGQQVRPRADLATACTSLSNVGTLLLQNTEFRRFLGDLTTVGRQVFRDTAVSLSTVSDQVGKEVALPDGDGNEGKPPHANENELPSSHDLEEDAVKVSTAVADGAGKVAKDAKASLSDHVSQEERETLLSRLKQAVLYLRQKPDYDESISTLSVILRRSAKAYARAVAATTEHLEQDIDRNREADLSLSNFWAFVTSIGDRCKWEEVENACKAVLEHGQGDPDFEQHVDRIGDLVQAMLTDPAFYDNPDERLSDLYDEFRLKIAPDFHTDIENLFSTLRLACSSIGKDEDIKKIVDSAKSVVRLLERDTSRELTSDCISTFGPMAIQAIQYIPIPRLELATPMVDLLLENLVFEPGRTKNRSSFLPHRAKLTTQNDVEIIKGRVNSTSCLRTVVRLSLSGISVSAQDVGYWFRHHSWLLRFGGEGMASVDLDRKGIDIVLDLEVGGNRIDELLSVRNVHVAIHRFDYKLYNSGVSWLAWLLKPFLRPLIRTMLEARIASSIKYACASANRELLFARERLRAARVADPHDMWTFIRAVSARLGSKQDPDQHFRIGIDEPGTGVFDGVYAPGSLVKVWNEEGTGAPERVRQSRRDGWRNTIFDV